VVIRKALSADHDVELAETQRRRHATDLARDAASDGYDAVVVLGGDGTLNEAADGLIDSDCALAPIPGGSTNVFARTIGFPNDAVEATATLLEALATPSISRIGVGAVNDRTFLFHVGLGFDAAVVEQVERRGSLKRWAGHPLFIYSALATWLRHYDRRRPRYRATYPDGGEVVDARFGMCLNTNPYTFLGNAPLDLAPGTGLDTGLSLINVRTMAIAPTVSLAISSLRSGRLLERSRWVERRQNLSGVQIVGYGPLPYQVDGDYIGESEELQIVFRPDALNLVLPRTLKS